MNDKTVDNFAHLQGESADQTSQKNRRYSNENKKNAEYDNEYGAIEVHDNNVEYSNHNKFRNPYDGGGEYDIQMIDRRSSGQAKNAAGSPELLSAAAG